jgi:hypothetical protein
MHTLARSSSHTCHSTLQLPGVTVTDPPCQSTLKVAHAAKNLQKKTVISKTIHNHGAFFSSSHNMLATQCVQHRSLNNLSITRQLNVMCVCVQPNT